MFHTVNPIDVQRTDIDNFHNILPLISRKLFCQKSPRIASGEFYLFIIMIQIFVLRQSGPICSLSHEEQPVQQQVLAIGTRNGEQLT